MDSQQRRARTGRLAFLAATTAVAAALASGPGFAAGVVGAADPPAPTPTVPAAPAVEPVQPQPVDAEPAGPKPVDPTPVEPVKPVEPVEPKPLEDLPAFGAYLDYGPRGVTRMAELSRWLGGADLRVGHTYLPGDRWSNIEGAPDFLESWADWRNERKDRMFVLNVPMLERNEDHVSDAEVRLMLRRGADGQFDHHFRRLAQRLVDLDAPDTVIVLGWEMNGITYTHRCAPDPEAWKKYWNRIVTTMRSVPGQKFRFDFTPSRGKDAIGWTKCYPGDDTVDIIGMDSYDQPAGISFDQQVKEPYGLQEHVEFAKSHGKAISYPEWGLFRNGDNAEYMRRMLAWMDEHKPLYNTLTDYCPHGVWQCEDNPKSSEVYRSVLFGRVPGEPTPEPTPTEPTPEPTPTPTHPQNCTPMNLGDWVEYWIGGKLCMRFDWWERSR
ncbi:glycosyl hydrolase [Streptomyces sp. NPDC090106]|uniref:glycoside hydrolase family 26 protein n=1 Tax=Streptomyces sp. NPDC090106 TaxID=3365946 RepID=UPI0037F7E3D0